MLSEEEACGEWMPQAQEPCARGKGHSGRHKTSGCLEREKARLRARYAADPGFREERKDQVRARRALPPLRNADNARRRARYRERADSDPAFLPRIAANTARYRARRDETAGSP